MGFLKYLPLIVPLICVLLAAAVARATDVPDLLEPADTQLLKQSGRLFTIEFSPGDRRVSVHLAGNEAAEFKDNEVFVMGRSLTGSEKPVDLHMIRDENAKSPTYNIVEPLRHPTVLELNVKDKKHGRTEHFDFNLR